MAIISLNEVFLRFGDEYLFSNINVHIEQGQRICLIGRNGSGKSTLLKLMAGIIEPDEGSAARNRDLHIAYLEQDFPGEYEGTALDFCLHQDKNIRFANEPQEIEVNNAVRLLDQLGIDREAPFSGLSGGGRRKAMLARVLSAEPELLLLDEPTNHLDIESISWLEEYLVRDRQRSMVVITHDRSFARAVSNRTAELDRGELYAFDCGYGDFLRRRDELLAAEQTARQQFDKRLAEEEAWLRRGIKARRTRNEGRVKALMAMREEHRRRRERQGSVKMSLTTDKRSGDLVMECEDVSFSWTGDSGPPLIRSLSTRIMRGDRIGIAGPNGAGKTTLIKLFTGEIQPKSGKIRHGSNLQPLYFSQMREDLDPGKSLLENLSGGDDSVMVGGKLRHVNAYLQDFLFTPDRIKTPVGILSGGEKNRLMLAKLFTRPANLLILDEPTNDLDMETLDLLEELLAGFEGTVLLVSHDREFLDNVVSDLLILPGDGTVTEYIGSYSEWRTSKQKTAGSAGSSKTGENTDKENRPVLRNRKLSFKENKELGEIPGNIEALETRIAELHGELADPELYRREGPRAAELGAELEAAEARLAELYERWNELESLSP